MFQFVGLEALFGRG